jgi:hypothetical protein
MDSYYVYIYWRLDTNEPFYIGKGKGSRWKRLKRNEHFNRVISKYSIAVTIEKDNLTESEAFYWEEEIIRILVFEYGFSIDIPKNRSIDENLFHLTNMSWGGEGNSGHNSFENKTEEELNLIKKKISEANKGKNFTKEHRRNLSVANKGKQVGEKNPMYGVHRIGKNHPMWGKHHNEETKEKLRMYKGKDSSTARGVICITTKKIFYTLTEAGLYYNIDNSGIAKCCKGKMRFSGKYNGTKLVWRYLTWKHNKKYRIK